MDNPQVDNTSFFKINSKLYNNLNNLSNAEPPNYNNLTYTLGKNIQNGFNINPQQNGFNASQQQHGFNANSQQY